MQSTSATDEGGGGRVRVMTSIDDTDETYMSSAEWLKRHGLRARRLGFYDALAGVAFPHEDGVLDLKVAPPCGDDDIVDAVRQLVKSLGFDDDDDDTILTCT